jgi:periplasmic divalent cation tolerance protein
MSGSQPSAWLRLKFKIKLKTRERQMPDSNPMPRIVLTTASNLDEANRLAHVLVEEHLAACVSFIPAIQSVYRWQEKVESATEVLLLIKSGPDQLAALESRLVELHSYETPEFLILEVASASHPYLEWLYACLRSNSGSRAEPF